MSDEALNGLAEAAGLLVHWKDAGDASKTVAPDSLRAILTAMGLPCSSRADMAESRQHLAQAKRHAGASFVTATVGGPVQVPRRRGARAKLALEDGDSLDIDLCDEGETVSFQAPETPGYHRLEVGEGTVTLAVAPQRGFTVADAAPGRRIWGAAAQLYALRGKRLEPFGDFGALADFARALGERGADAVAFSPVHGLFAADPSRFGPYAPSTRLFLNGLFADPALLFTDAPMGEPGGELIDWPVAGAAKMARLHAAFERFQSQSGPAEKAALEAFRREGGETLQRHARFEALHGHFLLRNDASGWRQWPAAYHDPAGPAVAAFAKENAEAVSFHLFLQWLADLSLAHAQGAAKRAGMAIGLIADLAVGMDAGGSHAWSRPHDLLQGLSVGAPPDLFQPSGQDWGLAAFAPGALQRSGYEAFLATLRSAMKHAGGVRIDHAMGLRRLWLTPQGASAAEGAYLTYPLQDMLRLIALESLRARAIVVGEDLGTVPDGFRETTTQAGMMGMRVLWFERDASNGFLPPGGWTAEAMAMTSTHDLPTVAGWWRGRDIDWQVRLDRGGRHADVAEARMDRARDREALWSGCIQAGVADGGQPALDEDKAVVDAALAYVARSSCDLAILPLEDLLGLVEQPNLPGTTDEHPNWRRRLAAPSELLLEEPAVAARLKMLNRERAGGERAA